MLHEAGEPLLATAKAIFGFGEAADHTAEQLGLLLAAPLATKSFEQAPNFLAEHDRQDRLEQEVGLAQSVSRFEGRQIDPFVGKKDERRAAPLWCGTDPP